MVDFTDWHTKRSGNLHEHARLVVLNQSQIYWFFHIFPYFSAISLESDIFKTINEVKVA